MSKKDQGAGITPPITKLRVYAGESAKQELAEHLIQLPGTGWRLWRLIALRGAGFPATGVLKLSDLDVAAAADRLLDAEDEFEITRRQAAGAVNVALDSLKEGSKWKEAGKRDSLLKAIHLLKHGKVPEPINNLASADMAFDAMREAAGVLESRSSELREAFKVACARVSKAVCDVACDDRFREAIVWQNRRALHTGINPLIRKLPGHFRDSKDRRNEELIASYWQRYCTKNDTIGFFGPVAWARIVPEGPPIRVQPGQRFLAARRVYFEEWCINALCEVLAKNKEIYPWLPPRRFPFIRLEGMIVHLPDGNTKRLSSIAVDVLRLCDGSMTAIEIAKSLMGSSPQGGKSEREVYEVLTELSDMGLLSWTLEIADDLETERPLRQLLERIEDQTLRRQYLEPLNELQAAASRVADAAGNAEQLDRAMQELETTFTRLTGVAATREGGKMYAGRTPVFEDCRRDVEVGVGPDILRSLAPPLSLLLASARWLSFEMAASYREIFSDISDSLISQTGESTVDILTFWSKAEPLVYGRDRSLCDKVIAAFHKKWLEILSIDPILKHIQYSSEVLRPRVLAAFDAARPGWKAARYHSPDIMIAASGIDAIRSGQYQLVLGELHMGINTIDAFSFFSQHPSPGELFEAIDADFPEPRIVPVLPRDWGTPKRNKTMLQRPTDFYLQFGVGTPLQPGLRTLSSGELVVERSGDRLMVRTRDNRLRFDIIEFFSTSLSLLIADGFNGMFAGEHTPRLTIDNLVVSRETWQCNASEIEFAYEKDAASRFVQGRRWARAQGMPRFVYVKTPIEVKPFYLDFSSPIYTNLFARAVRNSVERSGADSKITISEMLPTIEDAWLIDYQGDRYTAELRIVAVDKTS